MKKLYIDYNMIRLGEERIKKKLKKSYRSSLVDSYLDQAQSPSNKKKKTIDKRNIRIKLWYQLLELDPNVRIW